MANERVSRETRLDGERPKTWTPPTQLPDPTPQNGFTFRWVRTATMGQSDPQNFSYRSREGWVPAKASDHPELSAITRLPGAPAHASENIEIGGLILCKAPTELMESRNAYYRGISAEKMAAADNSLYREQHPSMPIHKPERSTRVAFGVGAKQQ